MADEKRVGLITKMTNGADATTTAASDILKKFGENFICIAQREHLGLIKNLLDPSGVDSKLINLIDDVLTPAPNTTMETILNWLISPDPDFIRGSTSFHKMKFNSSYDMPFPCYLIDFEGISVYITFSLLNYNATKNPPQLAAAKYDDIMSENTEYLHQCLSNNKPKLNHSNMLFNFHSIIDQMNDVIRYKLNENEKNHRRIKHFYSNIRKRLEQWGLDTLPVKLLGEDGGNDSDIELKSIVENKFKLLLAIPKEPTEKLSLAYLLQQLSLKFKTSDASDKNLKNNLIGGGLIKSVYNELTKTQLDEIIPKLKNYPIFTEMMVKSGYNDANLFLKRFTDIADWDFIHYQKSLLPPRLSKDSVMTPPVLKFKEEPTEFAEVLIKECFKFLNFVIKYKDNIDCIPADFKVSHDGKSYSVTCKQLKRGEIRYHTIASGFPVPLVAMDLIYDLEFKEVDVANPNLYNFEYKFSLCDNVIVESSIWDNNDYTSFKHAPKIPLDICYDLEDTIRASNNPDELNRLLYELFIECRNSNKVHCFRSQFKKYDGINIPMFSLRRKSLSNLIQTHFMNNLTPESILKPDNIKFLLRFYLWKCANTISQSSDLETTPLMREIQNKSIQSVTVENKLEEKTVVENKDEEARDDDAIDYTLIATEIIRIDELKTDIEKLQSQLSEALNELKAIPKSKKNELKRQNDYIEELNVEIEEKQKLVLKLENNPTQPQQARRQQQPVLLNAILEIPQLYTIFYCIMYLIGIDRGKSDKDKIRYLFLALCMAQNNLVITDNIKIPTNEIVIDQLPVNQAGDIITNFDKGTSIALIEHLGKEFAEYKKDQTVRFHVVVNPGITNKTIPHSFKTDKCFKTTFRSTINKETLQSTIATINGGNNIRRKRRIRKNKTIKSSIGTRAKSTR
jgi:hypothetical protein